MTIRHTLQCTSCDSKIVTRTQVGHNDKQEHSFPCPTCGVIMSFVLNLDQKKAAPSFSDPQNAKWVNSEEGAVKVLTFSDEIPVPVDIPEQFSPFILTCWNFIDPDEYQHDETLRRIWVRSYFPYCERCMVHFERGNWDLFDKESPPSEGERLDPKNRLVALYDAIQAGFSKFTLNGTGKHSRIMQRVTLANTIAPRLYSQLADEYLANGKILKLWKEIANVRRSFVDNYAAFQPLIQMAYWHQDKRDLTAFRLSDKCFDALRQLFIDCFETLCRLMVTAVGIEAIIHEKALQIPTKKGSMTLDEFERLPNGRKRDLIHTYPIEDLFLPVIDSDLRNNVGHNSAHYDPERDEIVLYDTKDSGTVKRTMLYNEFCDRVLKLFAAFELAAMYQHALHLHVGGRFS